MRAFVRFVPVCLFNSTTRHTYDSCLPAGPALFVLEHFSEQLNSSYHKFIKVTQFKEKPKLSMEADVLLVTSILNSNSGGLVNNRWYVYEYLRFKKKNITRHGENMHIAVHFYNFLYSLATCIAYAIL